jgi:hypothetical protein
MTATPTMQKEKRTHTLESSDFLQESSDAQEAPDLPRQAFTPGL